MGRYWLEATILGVCIGLVAFELPRLLTGTAQPLRWPALLCAGLLLCIAQYMLVRRRN